MKLRDCGAVQMAQSDKANYPTKINWTQMQAPKENKNIERMKVEGYD